MSRVKRFYVIAVFLAAVLVFIFTTALDLSRFLGFYNFYNSYPNDLIKRISVILAAALVWLAGRDSLNQSDNRLMKLIFVLICIGEAFFLFAKPIAAIGIFAVCQSLLILRHGKAMLTKHSGAIVKQKKALVISGFILICIMLTTIILLNPFEKHSVLSISALSYWIILSISLLTALANLNFGSFPKTNSRMIAIGMLCFYCCDVLVGLDMLLTGGTAWLLANSFIWIFYTPAITLLALSCYKYDTRISYIQNLSQIKIKALK